MNKKLLSYLLLASNLLFVALYFMLIWNNRLAIDDYYFLFKFNEYGIVDAVMHDYNTWSTRWTSNLLTHSVLWLDSVTGKGLFIFGLINIALFTVSVYLLLKGLLYFVDRNFKMKFWQGMNYALFVVSILFIATIRIGETWFWLCASCTYLWANMMMVLGFAWIFHTKKSTLFSLFGFLAFIYIGGASEPLAIITLFLLVIFLVAAAFGKLKSIFSTHLLFFRLSMSIVLCFVSFLILNLGSGIEKREGFFEEISFLYAVLLNFKMTGIILLKRLPFMMPYLMILGIAALLVGNYFKSTSKPHHWKLKLGYLMISYFILIFIYQFPVTYITHDTSAYRALMVVNLITAAYLMAIFFIIGRYAHLKSTQLRPIFLITLCISSGIFGYNLWNEQKTAFKYSAAVDKRMKYMPVESGWLPIIELAPLPPSGFLYSAELSNDTANFANKHFRRALHISQPVKVNK